MVISKKKSSLRFRLRFYHSTTLLIISSLKSSNSKKLFTLKYQFFCLTYIVVKFSNFSLNDFSSLEILKLTFNQSIYQDFIFSSVTQQIIILKCADVFEKKGISDKTIYVETCANSRL